MRSITLATHVHGIQYQPGLENVRKQNMIHDVPVPFGRHTVESLPILFRLCMHPLAPPCQCTCTVQRSMLLLFFILQCPRSEVAASRQPSKLLHLAQFRQLSLRLGWDIAI